MKKITVLFALLALPLAGACGDDGGGEAADAAADVDAPAPDAMVAQGVDNCQNQLGYSTTEGYVVLANILADDRLLVDATTGTCETYLGVEADVGGQCGGRSPTMDAVDTSYAVLAAGDPSAPVGDGVDADDCAMHDPTTFPFLAGPGCTGPDAN